MLIAAFSLEFLISELILWIVGEEEEALNCFRKHGLDDARIGRFKDLPFNFLVRFVDIVEVTYL